MNKTSRNSKSMFFTIALPLATAALLSSCSGAKSGISSGGAPGAGAGALANIKILTFQGNTSSNWHTATSSVWKTNISTISLTGTCTRGISGIKVNQRVSGSSTALADAGVTVSCVNNAFSWTKNYTTDPDFIATATGSSVQYDFNIYALDGLGNQVIDSTALTAVKVSKLGPTVLTNIAYLKNYVMQNIVVSTPTTGISDHPDPGTGAVGNCPISTGLFTLTGTLDPESTLSLSGATSTINNSSGTSLNIQACVPYGTTSLVLSTKDESGSSFGTQYTVNVTSSTFIQTLGSANEGFKFQALSPDLSSLVSAGTNLINISSDQFDTAMTASTGATGLTLATGLASYVQQVSP